MNEGRRDGGRRERVVDARLHLLSRQVLDVDGEPVTTLDDLELVGPDGVDVVPGREVRVSAIVAWPVLVTRVLGGHPPRSRRAEIPWDDVGHVGTAVELVVRADELDVGWAERWVRDHVVGRIPGGSHDPEARS
jgi:hypothetical protein